MNVGDWVRDRDGFLLKVLENRGLLSCLYILGGRVDFGRWTASEPKPTVPTADELAEWTKALTAVGLALKEGA